MMKFKLKALTSVVISLALLLSLCVFSTTGYASENVNNIKFQYALKVFEKLNLVKVFDVNNLENDKLVTRAEYITIICDLLNAADYKFDDNEIYFTDVLPDYWAKNQIVFGVKSNLISGFSDGTFRPDDNVEVNQAVKILVSALGYDMQARQKGGYPSGYNVMAQEIGLLKGLKLSDEYLDREDVINLLYNALHIDICDVANVGQQVKFSVKKGVTILSKYHRIYKVDGIMEGNSHTNLLSPQSLKHGMVVINGKMYNQGTSDAEKYIGRYVEAYYKESDTSDENLILFISESLKDNKNIVVDAEDICPETTKDLFIYDINDKDKKHNIQITSDMHIIYNGTACFSFNDNDLKPENGTVSFIDNNFDGRYDVVIVENYEDYVLDGYDVNNEVIYDKYSKPALDISDVSDLTIVTTNDQPVADLGNISLGSVLSVRKNKEEDYIKIIVSTKKISGVVNEYDITNDKVTIGNNVYEISQSLLNAMNELSERKIQIYVGETMEFNLNKDDKIAGIKSVKYLHNYGYMIKARQSAGISEICQLKILTSEGTVSIYDLEDKVYFDGNKISSGLAYNKLKDNPQLIIYDLNTQGKISMVDTKEANSEGVEGLSLDLPKADRAEAYGNKIVSKTDGCFYNTETKIFFVPEIIDDSTSDEDYRICTSVGKSRLSNTEAYNLDDYAVAKAIVIYSDAVSETFSDEEKKNAPVCIVERVINAIDDNKESVLMLKGIANGEHISLQLKDGLGDKLKSGDVIQYKEDNGKINAVNILFSSSTSGGHKIIEQSLEDSVHVFYFETVYAKVYDRTNSVLKVSVVDNPDTQNTKDFLLYPYTQSLKVYIYSNRNKTARIGKISDMKMGTDIFLRVRGALLQEAIIFEN